MPAATSMEDTSMTLTASRPPSAPSYPDVRFFEVPERSVLVVDRTGDPGATDGFPSAIQTLYPVAYTMKFAVKERGLAFRMGMPEGLFSVDEGNPEAFVTGPTIPSSWHWKAILEVPDAITQDDFAAAIEAIRAKAQRKRAKPLPPLLDDIRLERFEEGPVAEIMHVGPYEAEPPTIARLHAAISEAGLRMRGFHHEIYLGDPRKGDPSKLKTLIRQPVE
jgi:hypothetical protein